MKYVLIVPDGMADYPLPELDGQTPLQVAKTPNMDWLAQQGRVGQVMTIPTGLPAGSDVANMSLLGYNPLESYTGRGPLEALSLGVRLEPKDVAFRCNLCASDGERMIDYSAGHVTSAEARELIDEIDKKLGASSLHFYPGVSYRHLMVWTKGPLDVKCTPPHDATEQLLSEILPTGEGEDRLRFLIFDSLEILDRHPVNRKRREASKNPANMIWPWGQGRTPKMRKFLDKFGLTGSVVTAVDLIKGLGIAAGLSPLDVPGATGYLDTNYRGKADYALDSLKEKDFVFVHVEAPDEAGHVANLEGKIKAIEEVDSKVVGTLLAGLQAFGEYRILLLPDHATPISVRTHVSDPVPFVLFASKNRRSGPQHFSERTAAESGLLVEEGHRLIERLVTEE